MVGRTKTKMNAHISVSQFFICLQAVNGTLACKVCLLVPPRDAPFLACMVIEKYQEVEEV